MNLFDIKKRDTFIYLEYILLVLISIMLPQVQQPSLVKSYNVNMGGVDVMDKLLSTYRPSIVGKKWYFPLISHMLNVSVTNAWVIHKTANSTPMSHIDFRREVAMALLNTPRSNPPLANLITQPAVHQLRRYSGWNHFPESIDNQLRCAQCHKKAKFRCITCQVTLHPLCFALYHTPPE
jgi:hypothetical protein